MTKIIVDLSLGKAVNWYNSGNKILKELALQAYDESQLSGETWVNIKTFDDACKFLNIFGIDEVTKINVPHTLIKEHLNAIFKIDIIREALNGNKYNSEVFYPWVRFYKDVKEAEEDCKEYGWTIQSDININNTLYHVVSGDSYSMSEGFINLYDNLGATYADMGLFGCRTKEIAEHMSNYFWKEVIDACYCHLGNYSWC
jgi:hypothetical protein